ncbi:MAG: hypothetical protein FWD70_07530 [Desulfuromonadales bacterium]|nr:hypothetical protein [Desulfuromonadales bacterium]
MKAIVISILILASSKAFAGNCDDIVTHFLNHPTYENYAAFTFDKGLSNAKDICWPDLAKDYRKLARLYKHAGKANEWAVKILIRHTSDLDGGELEDALRALGQSTDKKPQILLREYKEHRMTEYELEDALVMLPLSLTDNEKGQLSALKARKKKFLSVKDPELKHQKEVAVKIIDDEIKQPWYSEPW